MVRVDNIIIPHQPIAAVVRGAKIVTKKKYKQLGKDRKFILNYVLGEMEIRAYARNEYNGNEYSATFNYFDENIAKVADEKFS
ncbi:unnamed protein product [Rhizophagus irregularis]|nr:unnamed protein product [Rhizophagus irregularis]